uniref:(northern house mosquito) hypothetical protein n=1 Tax=Culex pipiens TaxID=7175 RepID=A0A8D8GPB2_CULPI
MVFAKAKEITMVGKRTSRICRGTPPSPLDRDTRNTPSGKRRRICQEGCQEPAAQKLSIRTIGDGEEMRNHTAQLDKPEQNTSTKLPSKEPPLEDLFVGIPDTLLARLSPSPARCRSSTMLQHRVRHVELVAVRFRGTIRGGPCSLVKPASQTAKAAGDGVWPRGTLGHLGNLEVVGGEAEEDAEAAAAHVCE